MVSTGITLADFQPQELDRKANKFSVLLAVVERATEKRAAAEEESVRGGSSTNLAKRRKSLSQNPTPAEGLTNMIHQSSLRHGRAPPPPKLVKQKPLFAIDLSSQNNRLSIPIAQIAEESVQGGFSTNPAKRRNTLTRIPTPAERLTNMIRQIPLRRGIAPPPPPKLVIQKPLFAIDLSSQHNRLSIPIAQIDEESVCGGSSTDPAKRRKTLTRTPAPAERLTNMIRQIPLRRGIAPPPPPKLVLQKPLFAIDLSSQHNQLSIPIAQIAEESVHGGSSTDPEKRGKTLTRTPAPAERLTNMIRQIPLRRGIAPPPPKLVIQKPLFAIDLSSQHNQLSIPIAQIAEESVHGGSSTDPAKRRKALTRTLTPAERLTNLIRQLSRRRRIAQPPPKLVIEKPLFATDLSPQHNRLSIPISQIANDFLTEAEKHRLRGGNRRTNYLEVKIMAVAEAEALSTETAKLCRWDMRKGIGRKTSSSYIINGKWHAFAKKNNLTVGLVVQLWCFRLREELCFAIVPLPDSSAAA
ncbi:putative B3 domain-containing protein [Salvia divinorum]|uniref:B3 domain-containing protein n=1 Tax=Salvia divinorum TaxID=28513 RepID=A0ABD1G0V8_SALDI